MLGFRDFIKMDMTEGWSKPNKFPPLDEILKKMSDERPKRLVTIGKFWKQHVAKLTGDKDALRAAVWSVYYLGYMGKPLPPNLSSGFGRPERGYAFKARSDRYHTHITRRSKYTLCWQYGKGHSDIMFDLVPHKQYNEYLDSDHRGDSFMVPTMGSMVNK